MEPTFVVDIDDTIIISKKEKCGSCKRVKYTNPEAVKKEIEALNYLYDRGHKIILYTGRNWDCYDITVTQLKKLGVRYNELVMGKPQGVYVDKDAETSLKKLAKRFKRRCY